MNKAKYFLINGDSCIGIVYESDKYGRTLVLQEKLDTNYPLQIYSNEKQQAIEDIDLMEFIQGMLPK